VKESLAGLPSHQLLAQVHALVRMGNAFEAEMLAHLGEVDARRLYLEEGCSSMFAYCQRVLHFAEAVAYKRIQAARAARRHPGLLEAVREGRIHVTGASLLAPKLTPANRDELIRAAAHRSADEIRRQLADREPKPDVPATMRRLPTPAASAPAPLDPALLRPVRRPTRGAPNRSRDRAGRRSGASGTRSSLQPTATCTSRSRSSGRCCAIKSRTATSERSWPERWACCSGRSGPVSSASAPRRARSCRTPRSAMADPGAVTSLPRSGGP
jgi:hypothetical protein